MHVLGQLVVFVLVIASCLARPEGSIDAQVNGAIPLQLIRFFRIVVFRFLVQEVQEAQPSISDIEKFYSIYRSPQYFNMDDENSMDRLQQYQNRLYPGIPLSAIGRNTAPNALPLPLWNPYRQLVTKRQSRYRQCYFNPISCFRK